MTTFYVNSLTFSPTDNAYVVDYEIQNAPSDIMSNPSYQLLLNSSSDGLGQGTTGGIQSETGGVWLVGPPIIPWATEGQTVYISIGQYVPNGFGGSNWQTLGQVVSVGFPAQGEGGGGDGEGGSLLTIPSGLVKGTAFTVSLDKTTLLALPSVSANAHFSNPSKIAKCVVKYVGAVSGALINQTHFMNFDLSQATPQHVSVLSSSAADLMSISQVLLVDHEGAVFAVPASELPALNLSFGGGGGGGGSGTLTVTGSAFVPSPMPPGYYDISWDNSNPSYSGAWVALLKEVGPGMYNPLATLGQYSFGTGSVNGSLLEAGASYVLRLVSDTSLSPYDPFTQSATIASPVGGGGSGGGSGTLTVVNNSFVPSPMPGYYDISWGNSNPSYSDAYVALFKEVGPGMYHLVTALGQYSSGAGSVNGSLLEAGASYVLRLASDMMGMMPYSSFVQSATIASPVSGGGSDGNTVNVTLSTYDTGTSLFTINWEYLSGTGFMYLQYEAGPAIWETFGYLAPSSQGSVSLQVPLNTTPQYRLAVSNIAVELNATGAYSAPFSFQVNETLPPPYISLLGIDPPDQQGVRNITWETNIDPATYGGGGKDLYVGLSTPSVNSSTGYQSIANIAPMYSPPPGIPTAGGSGSIALSPGTYVLSVHEGPLLQVGVYSVVFTVYEDGSWSFN